MFEEYCDRCGEETIVKTMSQFNTQEICLKCQKKEKAHPKYEEALKAEQEAIKRGNHNFKGIGLPSDLK